MNPLMYVVLIAGSSCLAHYRDDFDRNVVEREEPRMEDSILVECPVCVSSDNWVSSHESCPIEKGNKRYKRCELGTYVNELCGNRLDCFRGPGERCTEKMEYDVYGQRCARGLYCNKALGVCTGLSYAVDSNVQWHVNRNRYPLRARRNA